MLNIQIKPIKTWIGAKTEYPRRSQFRQTYSNTKKILEKELSFLDIYGDIELEMFIRSEDLRQDGQLRANARPYQNGVKLTFLLITGYFTDKTTGRRMCRTQTLTYPCDVFDDWKDNLRAIALSLEALRKVERYGVFKFQDVVSRLALPPAQSKSSRQSAAEFIAAHSDYPPHAMGDKDLLAKAYRQAATKLHPDKGGSDEDFKKLTEAYELLKK